jgi:hypothetical protein
LITATAAHLTGSDVCAAPAAGLMPAPLIAPEWGDRPLDDDWGRDSSRSRGRSRGSDADWDADREPGWGRRTRGVEEATASVFVKVRVLLLCD